MAFTLDQNVSGAAAAPQPVQNMSGTSIAASALGGLLDAGARQAKLRAGSGPTQNERDDAAFSANILKVKEDKAAGLSADQLASKYGTIFANLSLNEQQRAVLTVRLRRHFLCT